MPGTDSNPFDPDWTPTLHKDIYPGNRFKVNMSTLSYGQSHPPEKECYNVETGRCTPEFWTECRHNPSGPTVQALLARYNANADFLLQQSSVI